MAWNQICNISEKCLLGKCYQNVTQGYEVSKCFWKKRHQQICSTQVATNLPFVKTVVSAKQESETQYLDAVSKMTEWFLFTRQTIHYHVIQVYCPSNNAEDAEFERFYEDLQDFLELTAQIRCPFHYRGLECKSRKSRNTWSNRQIWPWVQNEAQQRLREFCQENTKVMANTLFQ